MAMVSVSGEEIIVGAQARNRRYAGSFLPDIKVVVTAENAFIVQRHQILFKVTDDEHPPTQVQQRFARQFWQHIACDLLQKTEACQRVLFD
jgi:hypothetical protein